MASKSKRHRDFRREYRNRVARGLASGKSLSQSRGHPRAIDLPKPQRTAPDRESPFEKALKFMKQGVTQKEAARSAGVSVEKLRLYQHRNTVSRRSGRHWVIVDKRPVTLVMATEGRMLDVTVSRTDASDIGRHWVAINKFLETNNPAHLRPFIDLGLRDVDRHHHAFETRPNVLRRMDSIGELSFVEIYRPTAQ